MLRKHRQRHRMLGLLDLLRQQNCTNRLQLIKDVSAVSLSIPDINFSDRHLGRQKVLPEVIYFYVCLQFFFYLPTGRHVYLMARKTFVLL